jgi:hypothetical protein
MHAVHQILNREGARGYKATLSETIAMDDRNCPIRFKIKLYLSFFSHPMVRHSIIMMMWLLARANACINYENHCRMEVFSDECDLWLNIIIATKAEVKAIQV